MISLAENTIDNNDINSLINWLSQTPTPRLTKGPITKKLEEKFANWLGSRYAIFVNSGSSANLLMLYALIELGKLNKGDKVAVPALSWATDLAPIIQLGLEPILIDCNLENLSIDINHFNKMIKDNNIKALMLVSVLGLVPNMSHIVDLCKKNNIILLEDTCESMGSKFNNKKLGTFGLMSSFSTYFGHHISTIEGGFICTNNNVIKNMLVSLRSHGWDRDLDKNVQKNLQNKWKIDEFNSLYTFYTAGFNVRSTDLQAYIGLGQLDKLNKICVQRNENFKTYMKLLKVDWKPEVKLLNNYISNFAFPLLHPNKDKIVNELINNDIEVRPLICGSHGTQPMYKKRYGELKLQNATYVDEFGFYVPNHQNLTTDDINKICNIINSY